MAVENKRLKFIMDMVDKVTGPAQKVGGSLKGLGTNVKDTQGKITALQKQAENITSLKSMQDGLSKVSQRSQELTSKLSGTSAAHEASKVSQKASSAELSKAEAALKKATLAQGQNSHVVAMHQARVEKLRKAHEANRVTTQRYKQELASLKREGAANTGAMEKQQQAADALTRKLRDAGVKTHQLSQEQTKANLKLSQANRELASHQAKLDAATRKQEQFNKAKERYNKLTELSNKLAVSGAVTMAGGAATAAGAIKVAEPYRAFDKQMSAVQATGGFDDATKARLSTAARKDASTSAFEAFEVGQAQEYLAMAGFKTEQILASQRGILDLAAATSTSLAETADIGSNILSGFGLDPEMMGRVGDVLTKVTTSSNTNLAELGETMKYIAPVAKSAGYELESMAAAAGLMANVGIKGSQAGTGLRAAVLRMASLPKAAKKAFDELGVMTTDAAGNMRPLEEVLVDVSKAMEGMGSGDKLKNISKMFGVEASAGLAELLDKSSAGDMEAYIAQVRAAQGDAAKAASTRLNNLDGDLKLLGSGWAELRIKYGQTLDPIFRGVAQWATRIVATIDDWMARNPRLVKAIGVVAIVGGVLTAALGALLVAISGVVFIFAKLYYITGQVSRGLQLVRLMVTSVSRALLGKVAALTASITASAAHAVAMAVSSRAMGVFAAACRVAGGSSVLAFGLIGVAIAAVVAAGYLLIKHWDAVKAYAGGVWDGFSKGMAPVLGMFDDLLDALGPVGEVLRGVGRAVGQLGDWFMGLLAPVEYTSDELKEVAGVGEMVGRVLALAFRGLLLPINAAIYIIDKVTSTLKTAWDAAYVFMSIDPMGTISELWGALPGFISGIGSSIADGLGQAWELILQLVGLDPMVSIQEAWGGLGDWFSGVFDGIYESITSTLGKAWDKITSFGSAIKEFVTTGGGLFGGDVELEQTVNEAPKKDADTGKVKAPASMRQGGQIQPKPAQINSTVSAPTTVHVTVQSGDPKEIEDAITKALAKRNAELDRQARGRMIDAY